MRRLLVVLTLSGIGALADAQTTRPPEPRPPGPLLRISAVALDKDDRPVMDLQARDLEVWIGGYRIPIEALTIVDPADIERGHLIVLLLDDTTLPLELIPRVKDIARRFVNRMAPDARWRSSR